MAFFVFTSCKSVIKQEPIIVSQVDSNYLPFSKDTVLDLYETSILLPKHWGVVKDTQVRVVADATARFIFHNRNGKILKLSYGLSGMNVFELEVVPYQLRESFIRNGIDTSKIIFSDSPKLNEVRSKSKYNISEFDIHGSTALFYEPKDSENIIVGVYVDSIGTIAGNKEQLLFSGVGLDSLDLIELRDVIKTFKLKSWK